MSADEFEEHLHKLELDLAQRGFPIGAMRRNHCSICGNNYYGYGNNALPVIAGRCCNQCNTLVVIPARMREIQKRHGQ